MNRELYKLGDTFLKINENIQHGSSSIKIIIATHKEYDMPVETVYYPLHVGADGKDDIGYLRDDSGINISSKNSSFCELTGLYWAWKNLMCDYLGLVHYRRYFTVNNRFTVWRCGKNRKDRLALVLKTVEVKKLLEHYDVIVPQKRRYYIETLYSHYSHSHYGEHLDRTREILKKKYPEYLKGFDRVMRQRSGYMFNMFIMSKKMSDEYCEWLFDILFELEQTIDITNISPFQKRLYGRISEIIFNVWLMHQTEEKAYKIKEIPIFYIEPLKWRKKAGAFLLAKFFHKKYEGSF